MPGIGDAFLDIAQAVGKDLALFGSSHLKAAIGQPGAKKAPQDASAPSGMRPMPEIRPWEPRPIPSFQPMPSSSTQTARAASKPLDDADVSSAISRASEATNKTGTVEDVGQVGESYAAEWQDLSIACAPCTMRHSGTMTEELQAALESHNDAEKREHLATFAAEGWSWLDFDTTAEKLARTPNERDRLAVAKAAAAMQPVIENFPTAPRNLVRAWGAMTEAKRFARSAKRTERDDVQVEVRMERIIGWVGSLDTQYSSDPSMQDHLDAIRKARHSWTRTGYTGDALTQAEIVLHAATVDMTPIPDDETIRQAHHVCKAMMRTFFHDVAASKGRISAAKTEVDRDLPGELTGARLTAAAPAQPLNELLGATPATDAAFRNILAMQQARGVPVREENLPPVIEKGEVLGTIQGAYLPSGGNVWLAPAAVSESPNGLFTLVHETAHSLLHSPACDVYADTADYANDPHEIEANAAAAMALMDMGLPFEDDEGHRIDSREVRLDLQHLERRLSKRGLTRVTWAAGVLKRAMAGDPQGAAQESGACPR